MKNIQNCWEHDEFLKILRGRRRACSRTAYVRLLHLGVQGAGDLLQRVYMQLNTGTVCFVHQEKKNRMPHRGNLKVGKKTPI